jgi:hypothetical protein
MYVMYRYENNSINSVKYGNELNNSNFLRNLVFCVEPK